MQLRTFIASLALAGFCLPLLSPTLGEADPIARLPEYVVKDQSGTVFGVISQQSFPSGVLVLRRDTTNNQNYHIQITTTLMRGADDPDVYFTNANCTGTAYVEAPSTKSSFVAGMRGSVYVVGPDGAGGNVGNRIYRGAGAGADNDAAINSRFRGSLSGSPTCTGDDPGVDTVQASIVDNLSTFVTPFVIE